MRCVVLMVTVVVPDPVKVAGETVQEASDGSPPHPILTVALNPNCGDKVSLKLIELPATTLPEVGEVATLEPLPNPPSETDCGLPEALSLTSRVPDRDPVAFGVKFTLTEQVPLGGTVVQEDAALKSLPSTPTTVTLVTLSDAVPVFWI